MKTQRLTECNSKLLWRKGEELFWNNPHRFCQERRCWGRLCRLSSHNDAGICLFFYRVIWSCCCIANFDFIFYTCWYDISTWCYWSTKMRLVLSLCIYSKYDLWFWNFPLWQKDAFIPLFSRRFLLLPIVFLISFVFCFLQTNIVRSVCPLFRMLLTGLWNTYSDLSQLCNLLLPSVLP